MRVRTVLGKLHILHTTAFFYFDVRRYINALIVERLISRLSRNSGQYKTTTTDRLALDNDMSRIPKITHARLVAANVYYRSFGKLFEGLLYFEDFEAPIVKDPSSAKVVEMLASSSPLNSFNGRFFGFVKCLPRLEAI